MRLISTAHNIKVSYQKTKSKVMETSIVIVLAILPMVLFFWAIIDITKSRFKNPTMRTVWYVGVLFFPIVGSIAYFQFKKKFVNNADREFKPDFNRISLGL